MRSPDTITVFVGYDPREDDAARVCEHSIHRFASKPIEVIFIKRPDMEKAGFYDRPSRIVDGQRYDVRDGKPFSTEFSFTRFLVPYLMQHRGRAIFCDCDFLFLSDIAKLDALFDDRFAVQVVKHEHKPTEGTKMDGQIQSAYRRKNWSSLILWNCAHPAHGRLSIGDVNTEPGSWLHAFAWLSDSEIGALPPSWNFLSGVNDVKQGWPDAVHFTLGGPWMPGCDHFPYSDLWESERIMLERAPA